MKEQISITVDRELLARLGGVLEDGLFRNKSHLFEYAVRKLVKEMHGNTHDEQTSGEMKDED